MHEVLTRRFKRISTTGSRLATSRAWQSILTPADHDGLPTTRSVVVDGGLPQVNAARAALAELGIDDVALVGLAKRLEEVWSPEVSSR